jgi:hypothetical protein
MKALEKDRNRRYETAGAFARDVQRYLHDEPVLACPPSAWYRVRKFARRNCARLALAARVRQVREAVESAVTGSGMRVELDRTRLQQASVKEGHFDLAGVVPR